MLLVNMQVDVYDAVDIYGILDFFTSAGHQVHVYGSGGWTVYPGGDCSLEQF